MDIRKLIFILGAVIFQVGTLFSQCDLDVKKCFWGLGKSKTVYFFVDNIVANEPQKQKIFLEEGYFYTFSGCTSPGTGSVIFGIQDLQGTLVKNNIVNNNELKEQFQWLCKKTGFYHLIFWLHEGAGCTAVQVSMHPKTQWN